MRFMAICSTTRGAITPAELLDETGQAMAYERLQLDLDVHRAREPERVDIRVIWNDAGRKLVRQERAYTRHARDHGYSEGMDAAVGF